MQAAHRIAEDIVIRGEILTGLQTLEVDPEFEDVVEGVSDHAFELGTAEVGLSEIKIRYRTGGLRSSDVGEERSVPFDRVDGDVLSTMRRVWVNFDTGAYDKEAFGRWLKLAKGVPVLISYYVVAHRVVYLDDDVVMWGETIQTRFVPFGRGDGYAELTYRVQEMIDKSDEEVVFVAGGIKLLFEELLS